MAPDDPPEPVAPLAAPAAPEADPVVPDPEVPEWDAAGVVQLAFVQERDPVRATELWLARKASTPMNPATTRRTTAARALHCGLGG